MDCRSFRKHHLSYLDDTLSGELTVAAQTHVLACDCCAAHDTLVRRSLMMARSLEPIEPSEEFQRKLRARLARCRDDGKDVAGRLGSATSVRTFRVAPAKFVVVAAAGVVIGTLAWSGFAPEPTATVAVQTTRAVQPATSRVSRSYNPYITPALMQAMSTGNPVWSAAIMLDDAPSQFLAADFQLSNEIR